MTSTNWDRRFLGLSKHISTWSKDPSTQVGAVAVQSRNQVVGLGYNGFARGIFDGPDRLDNRALKYKLIIHAEVNALIMAGDKAKGCTLYVYPSFAIPNVCTDCAKFAIQMGVHEVVGATPNVSKEVFERWKDSIELARQMLDEAGVKYRSVDL